MEERIQILEKEIEQLKERNRKVDTDKAWEKSSVRIISVAVITYIVALMVMYFLKMDRAVLSALIPTVGYLLSTQSLPLIKRWWIKK